MVGIPKSNRCSFCKLRKTKCDEAWPTCSTCKRAGRECSGPPNYKFIINGNHSTPAVHRDPPAARGAARVTKMKGPNTSSLYKKTKDPGENGCVTACPSPPTAINRPPGRVDELQARLVYCLEASADTLNDLSIWGSWLKLLPPLLGESKTLRHAVELTTTAWLNFQSGQPFTACLDLQLYNKSLQSLQCAVEEALREHNPRLPTATLAAQTLVQRAELAFDATRVVNRENHSVGIRAAICAAGPKQAFSELDVHLIFENFLSMLKSDVIEDRDSMFSDQEWVHALRDALQILPRRSSTICQFYEFLIEMRIWPSLVKSLRQLQQDPTDSLLAMELGARASAALDYLGEMDTTIFQPAMGGDDIIEVKRHHDVHGVSVSYDFSSYDLGYLFGTHALFGVLLCRILQSSQSSLSRVDESVDATARHYSRRLWLTHPYMELRQPLQGGGIMHLSLSYEAGTVAERAAVVATLENFSPQSVRPGWVEATITANALAFTGRLPFFRTQDLDVELRGIGCRC